VHHDGGDDLGCSLRIISATLAESSHFRLSMPALSLPCRMRSMRWAALSSPSAFFSTERMYSSESARLTRPSVSSMKDAGRFDLLAADVADVGHGHAELLDFLGAQVFEHLGGFLVARARASGWRTR
jgi:hypothetical protein